MGFNSRFKGLTVIQADNLWGCQSIYLLTNAVFVTEHVTFPVRPITFSVTVTVVTNHTKFYIRPLTF